MKITFHSYNVSDISDISIESLLTYTDNFSEVPNNWQNVLSYFLSFLRVENRYMENSPRENVLGKYFDVS